LRCKRLLAEQTEKVGKIQARRKRIEEIHSRARQRWQEQSLKAWQDIPVSLPRLASELWQVVKDEDWVLASHALNEWVWRIWDFNQPGQCIRREGLGCRIGIAIGMALHYRDSEKLVIDIQPDGDFLFASSSLWTVAHYRIPLLIVMFNNRSYYNDEAHQEIIAINRKRPVENKGIGIRVEEPPVDFAALARSFGIYGEGPIEEPDKLRPALERAVQHVKKERRAALVDVVSKNR
jgi:thiamine pyrophosphate-dependent acetolactate synthase large subunit-like protein